MSHQILELKREKAGIVAQARQLNDSVLAEKRDFTAEEQQQYDSMWSDITRLTNSIQRHESISEHETRLNDTVSERRISPQQNERADGVSYEFRSAGLRGAKAEAFANDPAWRNLLARSMPEARKAFSNYLRYGTRALQLDNDTLGGYLQAPMQMADGILKNVDDAVYMRQWGTVHTVPNAASLGRVSLDADPDDADWTSEIGTGSEDSTMSFGRRELVPHPLAKRIKVSKTLLRKRPDAEGLVSDRLGYKFSITMEKAGLTGNGSNQPLGVFTASNDGIPTGRDISTDNTTTAVTFDGLKNAKYALKQQYWRNARWLGHRDFFKQVSKLKDGNNNYLWQPSNQLGQPDMLLGFSAFMSEYAPNTFTTGQYVGILGDFSFYEWADSLDFQVQVLMELYAETNQTGMIGRLESDGMPVLSEAFVRVTLA